MCMKNTCEIRFFVERDRHARRALFAIYDAQSILVHILFETVSSVASSSSDIRTLFFFICRSYLLQFFFITNILIRIRDIVLVYYQLKLQLFHTNIYIFHIFKG